MVQGVPQRCPRCGAEMLVHRRFCPRCGLDIASLPPMPAAPAPVSQPGFPPPANPSLSQPGFAPSANPPSYPPIAMPYTPSLSTPPGSAPQQYQQPPQVFAQQQASLPGSPATPPVAAARPGKRRRGRVLLPIALLVLVLLAVGGYFGVALLGVHIGPATQPAIKSTGINITATYADVDVTVQKVQQSQSFLDDPEVGSDGAVRLFVSAHNTTTVPVYLSYTDIAHLLLPGGKVMEASYVRAIVGIPAGATRSGLLDFPVPDGTRVDQLTLRLGSADDAPVDIPLRAGADLSGYAPKTTRLSGTWQYQGLDWSLVSATTQLSMDGKQAAREMHYLTLTVKVDNPLSQTVIPGSPYDYMRLKAGGITALPDETTLPVSFPAGARGQTGTVTFLVPQNAPTLTIIMVSQKQGGFDQATQSFRL